MKGNLSKPFIERPVMTSLVMMTFAIFGLASYFLLPVAALPEVETPVVTVTTAYPGANPQEVADRVTSLLEREFLQIQGIKLVVSQNTFGNSNIFLMFHEGIDITSAVQDVQQGIQNQQNQLPKDLPNSPAYRKYNPTDTPLLFAVVASNEVGRWEPYDYGYSYLQQQLGTVNGIGFMQSLGTEYALRIRLDPQALAAKGLSFNDVSQSVVQNNPQMSTGKFYGPDKSISTYVHGQLLTAEQANDVVVSYKDGAPIQIKDLGVAVDSVQKEHSSFEWFTTEHGHQGKNAFIVVLYKQLGANAITVTKNINALLDRIRPNIPKAYDFFVPFEMAHWIKDAVHEVIFTLYISFFLVILVVYLYLGKIRNSIIPLLALPVTILGSFIFFAFFDYTIDIFSLSAITISIGFLVDDAIVVLENIVRWAQEHKMPPYEAAMKGARQIILTVISISLCLAAVFLPMLLLKGSVGKLFNEFAGVILIAVLVSGFISLSFTPMLCSKFLARYDKEEKSKMEEISEKLNDSMRNFYMPGLHWALHHKLTVLFTGIAIMVLSVFLLLKLPSEFLPPTDMGMIQCVLQAQEGTSPDRMADYTQQVAERVIDNPYVANFGKVSAYPNDNQSMLFISLVDPKKRPKMPECLASLRKDMGEVFGVESFMKPYELVNLSVGAMDTAKAEYQYVLQSYDLEKLYSHAETLLERLQASDKLAQVSSDIQANTPMLSIELPRIKNSSFGNLTPTNVETLLMRSLSEGQASKMRTSRNVYDIIVEAKDAYTTKPGDMDAYYLKNDQGEMVALENTISSKVINSPGTINHVNGFPSVTINFNLGHDVALSEGLEEIHAVSKETLPEDIQTLFIGTAQEFKETMKQFFLLLLGAIFIVYLILGILYENYWYPIGPLTGVPISLLGGILSLIITQKSLSIYALTGMIMLFGIVMKNGILMIDFAKELMQEDGKSAEEAIEQACFIRFRPIVMTTIVAMMGALPIALGIGGGSIAEGRTPLGIVVFGGLLFSQIVSLFVTPVAFLYLEQLQEKLHHRHH